MAERTVTTWGDLIRQRDELRSQLAAARDELEAARKALRPFAEAADEFDDTGWPEGHEVEAHPSITINVRGIELRAARVALRRANG